MSIGSRIKERREGLGMTQVQLADLLGVTKGAIGNYETGANSPKASLMYKVFEVLQCDANYIYQDEIEDYNTDNFTVPEIKIVKKYRLLDQHGKEAVNSILDIEHRRYLSNLKRRQEDHKTEISEEMAGDNYIWLPLSEQAASAGTGVYLGPEAFEQIQVLDNEKTRRADFAVRVQGDSMQPLFQDGDIVLVSKDQPQNGDIALVTLDGCGYVKRLGDGVLISENKRYDPIPMDESIIVNGHVIGVLQPEWIQPWG